MGKYGIICHIILGFLQPIYLPSKVLRARDQLVEGINSWGSTPLWITEMPTRIRQDSARVYCNCSQWPGSYWTVQMYVKEHRRALSDWPESGPMLLTAEAAAAWPHSGSHNNTNQRTEQLGWLEAVTPVQLVTQITHKSTELVRSCTKRFCRELHRTCKG